jgi:hypothetical protein
MYLKKILDKNLELAIVKYIDYVYISNFISNSIKYDIVHKQTHNEWKIFSSYPNEYNNILHFIKMIMPQIDLNNSLLLSIHIYSKICKKHAEQINNYTNLFASVFVVVNNYICKQDLMLDFVKSILNISSSKLIKMIEIINKFIDLNDIYFGPDEKELLIENIFNQ